MLPEAFEALLQSDSSIFDITMKILHYGPYNNSIIRPGQILDVKTFSAGDAKLKGVYLGAKTMVKLLGRDIKSYLLKKIILLDDMKRTLLEDKDASMAECLFKVLGHQEIRKRLEEDSVGKSLPDFEDWARRIAEKKHLDRIPLTIVKKDAGMVSKKRKARRPLYARNQWY